MKTTTKIQTHIQLEGACNARHLGGYPTENGGVTRSFSFIRCESPAGLTDRDITVLIKLGVRTVIDLRSFDEIRREPNPFSSVPTIALHSIPVFPADASPQALMDVDLGDMYLYMLDRCQAALRDVLQTIARAGRGVLYHCSAGKDRTGIVSALLLLLAGVDTELVIEEYAYTQELLVPWVKKEVAKLLEAQPNIQHPETLFAANPAFMRRAIAHVNQTYGGVENYLLTIGLNGDEIDMIRNKIMEETNILSISA